MKHIGMEVSSTTTDSTVMNSNGKKILHPKIPARREELAASIRRIPGKIR